MPNEKAHRSWLGRLNFLSKPLARLFVRLGQAVVSLPGVPLIVRTAMTDALARPRRGWEHLYVTTVQGADTGADLDFLVGGSGDEVTRESH